MVVMIVLAGVVNLFSNFRSIRGSLSREVSVSPEEEVVARERKRSVKFKDREVVSRISESENSDLNHGGAVEEVKAPENETQDVNVNSTKGGGEEETRITLENGNSGGSKEETAVIVNGASDSSGA